MIFNEAQKNVALLGAIEKQNKTSGEFVWYSKKKKKTQSPQAEQIRKWKEM